MISFLGDLTKSVFGVTYTFKRLQWDIMVVILVYPDYHYSKCVIFVTAGTVGMCGVSTEDLVEF